MQGSISKLITLKGHSVRFKVVFSFPILFFCQSIARGKGQIAMNAELKCSYICTHGKDCYFIWSFV